jgi:hypothetical protein
LTMKSAAVAGATPATIDRAIKVARKSIIKP